MKKIGNSDIRTTPVSTGEAALEAIRLEKFDCIVLDLELPDINGLEIIRQIQHQMNSHQQQGLSFLPIVVYTNQELSEPHKNELQPKIASFINQQNEDAVDLLLDKTTLFLHRTAENLPSNLQQKIAKLQQKSPELAGKKNPDCR